MLLFLVLAGNSGLFQFCSYALLLCIYGLNEWGSYCLMSGAKYVNVLWGDMLKQKPKPVVMQCMGKGTSLRPHNEHWRASSLSATQEYILRIVYWISAGFFSLGLLQRSLQQKAEEALMVKSGNLSWWNFQLLKVTMNNLSYLRIQ